MHFAAWFNNGLHILVGTALRAVRGRIGREPPLGATPLSRGEASLPRVIGMMIVAGCVCFQSAQAQIFGEWQYKMRINFPGYTKAETLTNFPALVILNTSVTNFSYGQLASSSGGDLRFASADENTELYYEIEKWNTNGDSCVWVRVPALSNGGYIWAYWGNAGQTTPPDYITSGAMWNTGYSGVWHMASSSGATVSDATSAGRNGSMRNASDAGWKSGLVGNGFEMDGTDDYMAVPWGPPTDNCTYECWVKSSTTAGSLMSVAVGEKGSPNDCNVYFSGANSMNLTLSGSTLSSTGGNPFDGQWHHFAYVFGTQIGGRKVYVDGVQYASDGQQTSNLSGGSYLHFGWSFTYQYYKGMMDEIRVSATTRSSNWLWACAMNTKANSSFNGYTVIQPLTPYIFNSGATGITATAAWLNGYLSLTGSAPTTVYLYRGSSDGGTNKFSWGSFSNLGVKVVGPLSVSVTGLNPSSTYYYRYYATNSYGDKWATSTVSYTTYPAYPVISNSGGATGVTATAAWLTGNLASTGTAPTTVYLLWGTSDGGANMANWANAQSFGVRAAGQITTNLSGLTELTTYYYRYYATNSYGESWADPAAQFLSVDTNKYKQPDGISDPRQTAASSKATALTISEIMYRPKGGGYTNSGEYVELYNTDPVDYDIGGYRLSGDIDYTFPTGTVIKARSYLVVAKDMWFFDNTYGISGVLGPYSNNLSNANGTIRLRSKYDVLLLEVNYSSDYPWPASADGAGHSLVLTKPDYGEDDIKAWSASSTINGNPGTNNVALTNALTKLVINEFVAHTDPPLVDSIEIFNTSAAAVNATGCYLTDDPATNKYRITNGTINARGFLYIDQNQFGFLMDPGGETIYLMDPTQSYVIDAIKYPAQSNAVSCGRYPDGAAGFQALSSRTFGASNSAPRTADIVINEIMYHPISGMDMDEYVELYNKGANAVDLSYWRFTEGVDFMFPAGTVISATGYIVVANNITNALAKYTQLNSANTLGDYGGTFSDSGERVVLARPDNPALPYQDFVTVDEVAYEDGWGTWSDGGGSSLELKDARSDNGLAMNWAGSDETQKAGWTTVDYTGTIDNGVTVAYNGQSEPPNELRIYYVGSGGECLLDNITLSGGSTLSADFQSGLGGWTFLGNHVRSDLSTTEGYLSSQSLHLRGSDKGNSGIIPGGSVDSYQNRANVSISQPGAGSSVTIRAKARWLCGDPCLTLLLRGFWMEAAVRLEVPSNCGTPGAVNSRRVSNTGPDISEVAHYPLLPGAGSNVTITARVQDRDGIASVQLKWRNESDAPTVTNSVAMTDSGTGSDAIAGDGIYSCPISGLSSGKVVAFAVQAVDSGAPAATNRFPGDAPVNAPVLECLIRFGDRLPAGVFSTYHIWITSANLNRWLTIAGGNNSNEPIDITLVYNDYRVVYNAGARWRGLRRSWEGFSANTPVASGGINVEFPKPGGILGDNGMDFDVCGQMGIDATKQMEYYTTWIAGQVGIPSRHFRYVRLFFNEGDRGVVYDMQGLTGDFVTRWFGDDDPLIFKGTGWWPDSDPFLVYKDAAGRHKQSRYRWSLMKMGSEVPNDDYSTVFRLADAINISDNELYVKRAGALMDLRGWASYFVVNRVVKNWDTYGWEHCHNYFVYVPRKGRSHMFNYDMDYVFDMFGVPVTDTSLFPDASLISGPTTVTARDMFTTSHPAFRRAYFAVAKELVDGPMKSDQTNPMLQQWQAAITNNGGVLSSSYVAAPSNWTYIADFIAARRTWIMGYSGYSSATGAAFAVTTADFTSGTTPVTINGTAPVQVQSVKVGSNEYSMTWTDVTAWQTRVGLTNGVNQLVFTGWSRNGELLGTDTINVTYTGANVSPSGRVVISEIMYNPASPYTEFIELHNTSSSNTFDLGGMRLNGVDFTFPGGSFIAPTSYVVVAESLPAYQGIYSNAEVVAGEFSGNLDNGGETIQLLIPLTTNTWQIIDEVRYDQEPPWPALANGGGASLQLIDANEDNNRVGNWGVSVTTPYTPGKANSVAKDLPAFDKLWISEVMPTNASAIKDNAGEYEPWAEIYNGGASSVNLQGGVYYLSNSATNLTKWAFPSGWTINTGGHLLVWCDNDTGQTTATNLHAGFIMNSSSGMVALVKVSGGSTVVVDYVNYYLVGANMSYGLHPEGADGKLQTFHIPTPGAGNNPAADYEGLRINEWMARNNDTLADPTDGDFDDWFELYNAGTQAIDLTSFKLVGSSAATNGFSIPAGHVIPSKGYLLVWADGETGQNTSNSDIHVNFNLSATGDTIRVFAPDMWPVDLVMFGPQSRDISEGRYPDGDADIYEMPIPTPNSTNRLFAISSLRQTANGVVRMEWNTRFGRQYRILYTDSLTNCVWRTNGFVDINATGAVLGTNVVISGPTNYFYTIRQL